MVKGDATAYRKSIKGKMDKKQLTQYRTLLARETKGYAEAKRKLEIRKARGDFKPKPKKKTGGRRGADQNPKTNEGKETRRPKFVPEKRSVSLGAPMADSGTPKDIDPTQINVSKDAKKFGKFKPEFIQRISDTGLGDMERSQDPLDGGYFGANLVQYPTTTTGGEAIMERGASGRLEHPSILSNRLNEETIVGQTIDRGNNPQSKPRSWEGTKAGGYSKREKHKEKTPMTLERRMKKGAIGTIGKTDEELRKSQQHPQQKPFTEPKEREYANVPILNSVNYVAGDMGYKKDPQHTLRADLRIRQGAFSRGDCGDSVGDQTCSEFYLLNQRPTEIDRETLSSYEGRRGKTPLENFYNKAGSRSVSKPSELDYNMGLPMVSTKQSGRVSGKGENVELDIVRRYGGKDGRTLGTNELAITEGMSYSYDKSRPKHRKEQPAGMKKVGLAPSKGGLSMKDMSRLAKNRGVPTTGREEKSKEYEPAKLGKSALIKKLLVGRPVDMSYNYYGEAGTAGAGMSGFLEERQEEDAEEKRDRLRKVGFTSSGVLDDEVSEGGSDFEEENPMGDMDAYRY